MSEPSEAYRRGMLIAARESQRLESSKLQTAVSLRDLIISKLAGEGKPSTLNNFGPISVWASGGLNVIYRSPTRPMANKKNLEYGLDVWMAGKGKVFYIEWNEDSSKIDIVRFIRGAWEKSFE